MSPKVSILRQQLKDCWRSDQAREIRKQITHWIELTGRAEDIAQDKEERERVATFIAQHGFEGAMCSNYLQGPDDRWKKLPSEKFDELALRIRTEKLVPTFYDSKGNYCRACRKAFNGERVARWPQRRWCGELVAENASPMHIDCALKHNLIVGEEKVAKLDLESIERFIENTDESLGPSWYEPVIHDLIAEIRNLRELNLMLERRRR